MSSARFYETSTSGLNADRFVDRFDESTLTKVRQQYWTAKQLIRTKLGKKEDEHLLASDAEFDAKISLFRALRDTSDAMLCCIDDYQHYLAELVQTEVSLGRMLKEDGRLEKSEAGKAMAAVGRVQTLSAHYRQQIRVPLLRFLSELQVFAERAVNDCADTVEAAERARTEYRGSLLWMKKTSDELDPDAENALEKFRKAQHVVRRNKERLDGLKLDTLQKVDLLAASRCNLFSQLLESYQKSLFQFFEQTALAYTKIYDFVCGCKRYEFEVLKELTDPSLFAEKEEQEKEKEEEQPQSLIELEAKEEEMEQILFRLEGPAGADFDRAESPLGQPQESATAASTADDANSPIGPLPEKVPKDVSVPRLSPPPGWKGGTRNVRYSSELVDLLSLNESTSSREPFSAEWLRLTTPTSTGAVPLSASQSSSTTSHSNLPSQLLDLEALPNHFPNPFNETPSDAWSTFLSEYETSGDSFAKGC